MDKEAIAKTAIYIVVIFVAAVLAVHCSNVLRHASFDRLFNNRGNSAWVYRARFYFLILTGIGVAITQNVFIRKALKRMEEKKNTRNQE